MEVLTGAPVLDPFFTKWYKSDQVRGFATAQMSLLARD
jgi:hypothetical protein